ncbi:hypothetical protein Zm00014a_035605 [Zea mays]|uniref:Uncharacterized protein n=1 Tax=Zea mays TaxID=4577 RepID=A0A3L6F3N8_MAIZE|nr:hypothetical protein Zm00014a_035605 [Zea mays]
MSDSSPAPGAYYSGPPAAPPPESKPVDGGQVNADVPEAGYYSSAPAAKSGAGGQGSSAAPKESGFFATW